MIRLLRYLCGPLVALGLLAALPAPVAAQQTAKVLATCGSAGYTAGTINYVTMDTTGAGCGNNSGGGGGATSPYLQTPRGYQQVSVTTAIGFTPPTSAAFCYVQTETAAVRYRTDGTNPTTSVGMPLAIGTSLFLSITSLSAAKFIAQSGTATLDVDCYS